MDEKEKETTAFIDSCSRELAELDNDSFQSAFFQDANKIFEQLLLPMHFPWNHKAQRREQVLRGLPCDIDELLANQTPDDDSVSDDNEEDKIDKNGKTICNRSPQDKGLIEIKNQPSSRKQRSRIKTSPRNSVTRVDDVAFRMYQEVQSRKLHRQTSGAKASCSLVSIQCNGVSSEASIFTDVPDGKTPVLLPAIQPRDVANGKRMSVTKAKELSKQLGSYDCRYGLPDISDEREQSGRRRRVFAGRTRTIWTRREDAAGKPTSPSAQPTYTSIITGETLPAGSHKRPLPVKVGLKVNGKIVTVDRNEKFSADSLDKIDEINKAVESGSTKKLSNPKQSKQHQNGSRKKAR
ncbi:hypothetical protein FisN_7Lh350 [Fistulifera solaris]|uniref:Uncharacterized protein n=1 Tax=Fistulifera solaris TaxID=1519565 RepID=A0A1Z5JRG7_FISSO|nr:hypothetical protein FisN_7Lh350 [Fistulifera solaris]|eukprot:GAX16614.1 hypothetical protein FisN_7Lh350 [Fistulifera solaris]